MKRGFVIWVIVLASFSLMAVTVTHAGEFPERPITIVNPQAPGGAFDIQARALAVVAERQLGKPVVVVNKTGAQTMVGSLSVAQAAADGYTLLVGSSMTTTVMEWEILEGRKPPVTRSDFIPIGSLTLIPTVIVVPYDHEWKNVNDLIKAAKAKPNHYAFCSAGLLSNSHMGTELFLRAYGLQFRHVPYNGSGPCVSALVGKQVDSSAQSTITVISLAQGKKLRILALQADKRVRAIPDVPTLRELGANVENYMWTGLLAPRKTPPQIVARLREITASAVQDKAFAEAMEKLGGEVHFMGGEELAKFWEKESGEHAKLLTDLKREGLAIDR